MYTMFNSMFLDKSQIATHLVLTQNTSGPHTKHLWFFQKQKFMGLLYPAQEEYIYINVVSSFLPM